MSANAVVNQIDVEGDVTWQSQQPTESIKRGVADELHFGCPECREHWRELCQCASREASPTGTPQRRKRAHWYSASARRMAECHLIAHHGWSAEELDES